MTLLDSTWTTFLDWIDLVPVCVFVRSIMDFFHHFRKRSSTPSVLTDKSESSTFSLALPTVARAEATEGVEAGVDAETGEDAGIGRLAVTDPSDETAKIGHLAEMESEEDPVEVVPIGEWAVDPVEGVAIGEWEVDPAVDG